MHRLIQDLRIALRQLRRKPGFAAVAVLTLALGIGASTAIFAAVDSVLLRPLPYPDADRLVTLWQHDREAGIETDEVAPANFLDWRERSRSFETMAAAVPFGMDLADPEEGPEALGTWLVTEGFFDLLGVPALLGRTFVPEEHRAGGPRAVVLSHRFWRSRFGGDPELVGQILPLDGEPHTVVGVMPPEFSFPPGRELWAPKIFQGWEEENRTSAYWRVVGRLAPGVTLEAARAELDGLGRRLESQHPETNANVGISALPLREHLVRDARPALLLLLGAVGMVLLIACVNVANLLLARAADREREFALRAVLGASRARVIRLLLAESGLLALLGSLLGLFLTALALGGYRAVGFEALPLVDSLAIDLRVATFAVAVACVTALLFGLAPALHTRGGDLRDRLHPGGAATTASARRFRGALVAGELALAMVLLVGAGLFARSFAALLQVDRGYRTENVITATVQAWQYYPSAEERTLFVETTVERIVELPGVRAAGVTSSLPLTEPIEAEQARFILEDRPPPSPDQVPTVHATVATPGYFEALGISLRQGRLFRRDDDAQAPRVAVVNETLARRHWPGESPVGRRIRYGFMGPDLTAEVVGVVGDVRHGSLEEEPRPTLFLPHAQVPVGGLTFAVRTTVDPAAVAGEIEEAIWAMNPTMPIENVTTMEELLADSLGERRFSLFLVGGFALVALILASVGIYGLLNYEARRRVQEVGVRMALGADRSRVVRLVVGSGVRLALLGVAAGTLLALGAARLLSNLLFGVRPVDPLTFLGIAAVLVLVSALASYLPARRAAGVDPAIALRAE